MWNLITTVNYETDEKEFSWDYITLSTALSAIEETIKTETKATSFVFVMCTIPNEV